jgi:hypothetical protein
MTRVALMSPEAVTKFVEVLATFQPGWVLAIVVAPILAYRTPQIVKELFTGMRGLPNGRRSKRQSIK